MQYTKMAHTIQGKLHRLGIDATLYDIQTYIDNAKENERRIEDGLKPDWSAAHSTKIYRRKKSSDYAWLVQIHDDEIRKSWGEPLRIA